MSMDNSLIKQNPRVVAVVALGDSSYYFHVITVQVLYILVCALHVMSLNHIISSNFYGLQSTWIAVIRDRPKPVFLVSAIAESGAVTEVRLWP